MERPSHGVRSQALPLIGSDERGSTYRIPTDRHGEFILAYRRPGSSSGRHYHTGKVAYKDPEVLILISGEAIFRWRYLDQGQVQTLSVAAPARVEIDKGVWHELVAVTDCCFWEMNSLADVQGDSIRVEP